MKKILILIIGMMIGFGLKAQCPLGQAVDFTATDCHGTEVHLFDILDGGQYVLIDFFFYNCGACNETAPMMVQAYEAFGCNEHDVFFMEISDRDSDATCQTWTTKYGVEYPTISAAAGGNTITNQYGIPAWPTIILIAPNHRIVINDLWPIYTTQDIIDAMEAQGVEQHECLASLDESSTTVTSLFPNPANESLTLKGESLGTISIFNALGQKIETFETSGNEFTIPTSHFENGVYFIKTKETTLRFVITH